MRNVMYTHIYLFFTILYPMCVLGYTSLYRGLQYASFPDISAIHNVGGLCVYMLDTVRAMWSLMCMNCLHMAIDCDKLYLECMHSKSSSICV